MSSFLDGLSMIVASEMACEDLSIEIKGRCRAKQEQMLLIDCFNSQDDVKIEGKDYGKTFFFRINGEELFIRGSNWIPATLFAGRGMKTKAELLHSAARGGVQMLRVWGGGRYEDRRFYDLAGRLGIMVWQDMMFACAMYKKPPKGE